MKRKRIGRFLGIFLAAGISIGGTNAYFSDQIALVNEIQMGDVDIELREYTLKNGKEMAYETPQSVMPGDRISKIPRITNLAEPCWIRAKVQYKNETKELEGFSDENLSGISSKWKKQGEYYYYTEIVKEKESVDLFHTVKIPEDWNEFYEEHQFAIDIQAEAIQAVHFEPDFQAMSPWGNEEIELCVHEENDRMYQKKEQIRHKIEFNGQAHKLISVSDDFFSNFGSAMPGDLLSDYALLENTTKKPAAIYFHTELLKQKTEQDMLLSQLGLELKLDGKTLYKGSLSAEELNRERCLVVLKPEEKGKLEFTVSVPKELKNAAALQKTEVKWVFRVQEDEEEQNHKTPEITPSPNVNIVENGYEQNQISPVKTGDLLEEAFTVYLRLWVLSGLAIGIVLFKGEKRNEEKKNKYSA